MPYAEALMLTELIGLPGSGKTTFEKKLTQGLDAKNTLTRKNLGHISLTQFCVYLVKQRKLVGLFILGLLYNFEFEITLLKWRALIRQVRDTLVHFAKIDLAISNNPDIQIFMDEGLLERTISIYSFHSRKHNLFLMNKQLEIISKLGIIDRVYYLKVSRSLSIIRCKTRPEGLPVRYRFLENEELIEKFNNKLSGLENIKAHFNDKLIELRNDQAL
jgi:hypothetical protein